MPTYSAQLLDSLRYQGDPAADAAVAAGHSDLDVALPKWAEPDRLARAARFFSDHRLHIGATLALGSLVTCYAIPRGARLLAAAGGLHTPLHRVSETAKFLLKVTESLPDPDSIARVRLVHATARHRTVQSGQWDVAADGVPICQEDQLGALMLFSVYVLVTMRRLGARPTSQESEDYYHLWRVVGAMAGIPPDVLPSNVTEAIGLCELMERRHVAPSVEGIRLTRLLIREYQTMLPGPLGRLVPALMRHVVSPHVASCLAIKPSRWDRVPSLLPHLIRARRVQHTMFAWFLRALTPRCSSVRGTGARPGSARPRCCSRRSRPRRIRSR